MTAVTPVSRGAARRIDFDIPTEELATLQAQEPPAPGPDLDWHDLQTAWHLRQRDSAQALATAQAVEAAMAACGQGDPDGNSRANAHLAGRIGLVRAEVCWLNADFDDAQSLLRRAVETFTTVLDAAGLADAALLQAQLNLDLGDVAGLRRGLADAARHATIHARRSADEGRRERIEAMSRFVTAAMGGASPSDQPEDSILHPPSDDRDRPPGVNLWHWNLYAQTCFNRTRLAEAIPGYGRAAELALQAGQIRQAILALCNVGTCYNNLGDHDAALVAVEQALALARPRGWPLSLGMVLYMAANLQRMLGRLDAAQSMMDEALAVLHPMERSRQYVLATVYAGELALHRGDWSLAESRFASAIRLAGRAEMPTVVVIAQRGRADALRHLGQTAEARDAAGEALRLAEAWGFEVSIVDALQSLASLDAERAIEHLRRAIAVGATIDGFVMPPSVWQDLAAAHAGAGDHCSAYAASLEAAKAHQAVQNEQATQRALALEIRHQAERARAESQQLRERAAAEERRAEMLEATNAMLGRLGAIGQQITAQLDLDQVFGAIYAHLRSLLDLQHLSIWLLDNDGLSLRLRFGTEEGRPLHSVSTPVANPTSNAARCVREGREVMHQAVPGEPDASHMPGTLRMQTSLFGPLRVRDRVIGVLSIQSSSAQAYGERERLIFGTLCAYGAIALDNAHAHHALQQARHQAELATQHKSDFLANVSHDLRTPLAAMQGYLETLIVKADTLAEAVQQKYLATALAQSQRMARLVQQVLDLARLETGVITLAPETFSVAELAQDVVQKCELAALKKDQWLRLDIGVPLPPVQADIAMIERVLTNLLDNAIQHTPPGTRIDVVLAARGDGVCVEVRDTGPGVDAAVRDALFRRPVANPRPHRPGGGGLGLLIVKQLLQQHGCEIALEQRPGHATAFCFCLPAVMER